MKKSFLILFILVLSIHLSAQNFSPWPGKKYTVVLTYDDALNVHLDNVIPLLDSLGLKGTFYLTAYSPGCSKRIADWRKAAAEGHELGNHTLFHPCIGNMPGREWVTKDYDMSAYSVKRMIDETRMTNIFLEAIDGKTKRTFAFTCGDMKIGDSSFINAMRNDFIAARAVRHEMHTIDKVDLYNTDCYAMNGESGEQMIELVKKSMNTNSLLIFLFHGVGGEHAINVSRQAHSELIHFLKQNEKDIWVAPMLDVAEYIKDWQHRDSVRVITQKATQEDYSNMLAQLKITSTRPGPSGNPQAPNAANADESKATLYTSLPDPLILKNGKTVLNADTWWKKRRAEIVEDFDKEIYGHVPSKIPAVKWQVVKTTDTVIGNVTAIKKDLLGHVDNSAYPQINVDIQLTLVTPAMSKPVPVIMEFSFVFPPGFRFPDPAPGTAPPKSWQEQVLSKGYGYAIIIPTSYQADNGAGLTQGIIGLVNKGQPRKPGDWGTLRAWAWGASRAIDYFETDKSIDAKKVGIEGLSRYGKAALVTMAYEPRIAIGFIGSSGAGGAKLLRRVFGEQVENLASSGEYHWFAGNFIKYAGPLTPKDLPVDAHELIALCAPRPVFISVGSPKVEGQWVDAKGMFLAGVYAGPVYRLLGKKDLGTTEFPVMETNLAYGDIAFRQHSGGHTTGPNWSYFLDFAERYFK